jgi:hypothetical protein
MGKQIEIVNVSDPITLKQQLGQMVNVGWSIKGVVSYNPNDANREPFVILERDSDDDPTVSESLYENEVPAGEQYSNPEPPRKEISISMGN